MILQDNLAHLTYLIGLAMAVLAWLQVDYFGYPFAIEDPMASSALTLPESQSDQQTA
jgi:hypothetical protein